MGEIATEVANLRQTLKLKMNPVCFTFAIVHESLRERKSEVD